ncbi:hypothetical protein TIFTF001_042284 [Ficus carica]|uniref:Uncharacterized protein n=1 Tax=Ficus carica TaxID=3494 RepID=A0AA87ZM61_FICCA|nr:hypothetical protein TIFTF001_042284 [Ficus carica]
MSSRRLTALPTLPPRPNTTLAQATHCPNRTWPPNASHPLAAAISPSRANMGAPDVERLGIQHQF